LPKQIQLIILEFNLRRIEVFPGLRRATTPLSTSEREICDSRTSYRVPTSDERL
jgi:hypothetical protein